MKKIAYLSILAGLFLTACTEGDYGILPADPQVNEQEAAVTFPTGLTAVAVSPIDLAAVEADSVAIAAYTPAQTAVGEVSEFRIILEAGQKTYELPVAADMKVPVDSLQNIVVEAFGKRPAARTFTAVLEADVMVGGQATYVASEEFDVVLTPVAPFISSAYYLIGNMNGWNTDDAKEFKFNHSGKDVYEDPVFSIVFTASADCYWKIIPQSNYDAENPWRDNHAEGVVGVVKDGDDSLEGTLVTASPQAGKIAEEGMYMMTINMMDYTYSIKALAPEYYILGDNPFGWNVNDKKFLMYAESSSVQTYTTEFAGNIKMINSNDMGTDNWDACYGTPKDGDTAASGTIVQKGGAIHVPAAGYYTLKVDFSAMTYSWTPVTVEATYTSMAVVGDFQGWNPANADTQMTEIAPHNWYIKDLKITSSEFKIAANGKWDDSWGEKDMTDGNYGVLASGGNCAVVPGTYDIFFNDITKHCTIIAK